MSLLIAILLALGFHYTPEQIQTGAGAPDANVIHAQQIIDEGLYYYGEDGGIILEDDVDPNN
jgi:hypothetical protein